ncbi:HNH endonuclease signature motif containing protein [Phytoactinopolyspora mesophila]|uniref:DUF222 domain-containing protein n=1 Tax=Phytoactinopolyspora mesophila TaxID=2650750 RepID=A0A7K3LZT3_9ACTN|nr:HNH endonuclease signature motif containing protein [Phytoactinopolyspora mesophila]NDL55718.1 DUF222 domain-containing protein [Phytoactinopolyspora mesophila]
MFDDGVSGDRPPHVLAGVLDAAEAVFDEALDVDASLVGDDDLVEVLARCHALAARQGELFLRVLAEVDTRDLGRRLGASSTTAWVRDALNIRPGVAKSSVDLAHRLTPPVEADDYAATPDAGARRGAMPATRAGLAAGEVSLDHATVIAKTMAQLPTDISAEDAARAEADLAAFATEHDPATLQRLATHLLHVLSTDSLENREERAQRKRRLRLIDNGDGTVRITGLLSTEGAATVRTALDPLAAPQPGENGERDPRAPDQRLADALVELCQRHLQAGTLPTNHGHAPQLLLLAELSTLLGTTGTGPAAAACAQTDPSGENTTEATCTTGASCAGQQHRSNQDHRDDKSDGRGNGDGIHTGIPGRQPEPDPGSAGCGHTARSPRPARQWLRDTWAQRFGVAPAELGWGGPISTETLRRITCDASITPVLVGPHGVPLRVGRAERIVTPGIWTALVARDRGCAFPTCTRPPAWCQAHHIRHWSDGGGTDLENMVLLCAHHHRVIHHGGWDVHIGPDGHPVFVPPPWIDPDRTPRRNTRPRHDHQPPPSGEHPGESDGQRTRRHRMRPPPPDT